MGVFDALLGNLGRVTDPMQRTIAQSGLKVTVSTIATRFGCALRSDVHRCHAIPSYTARGLGGRRLRGVHAVFLREDEPATAG